ncbi:MAG: ABC transporter permease subunit [Verrucomicrobia bacterium]|nr:ABC transporter permease subunit [Verrucomicrobiota bacterium]MBT7701796.1 ABC transporter permease subunit [Verrucomicrobiota bacterium]
MMGLHFRKRSRFALHACLFIGSAVFLIPFLWLLLTAMKEDEELVPERLRILPSAPEPRAASPYVDRSYFGEMACPEALAGPGWARLQPAIRSALRAQVEQSDIAAELPVDQAGAIPSLVNGLWANLLGVLPDTLWSEADDRIMAEIGTAAAVPGRLAKVFDAVYRRAAISSPILRKRDFVEVAPGSRWVVTEGGLTLAEPFGGGDQTVRDLHYRFGPSGTIRLTTRFTLPFDPREIKQISIPIRADRSCHRVRVAVSMKGKRFEAEEDFVLVGSRWSEVIFQEPSADDSKPMQRNWTLVHAVADVDNLAPNELQIEATLVRSGPVRAWRGKLSANFRRVLKQVPFDRYLWVSIFLACANITLTILSSSIVAYAFARMEWPGRKLCFVLLLSTLMIPAQVTMIPQFIIFKSLGWYNTLFPLWVPSMFGNAFFVFLLVQAMKGIPKDLTDAAKIDGCGFLRTYWNVILPNVRPALAAVAIFTFMGSWNNFMGPLIYVNDQRLYNLALGLFSFQLQSGGSFSLLMAGSLIMVAPVLVIFFLAQRYFIQGVVMSGVKG